MKKTILLLFLLIPVHLYAGQNLLVDTTVFSIEVPNNWSIDHEVDKGYIFAHSVETYDGWPTEMLLVDFCQVQGLPKEPKAIQCDTACSKEKLVNILKQAKNHEGDFQVSKITMNGVSEFRSEIISERGAKISTLSCSNTGQAFMILSTSQKPTEEFLNVLGSIKWK